MAYNTVADIKRYLNLDSADQTISDADITLFLADANEEVFSELKTQEEVDNFKIGYSQYGEVQQVLKVAMPIQTLNKVVKNGVELTVTTDYTLDTNNNVEISLVAEPEINDIIKVHYIPLVYKKLELYECLMMLRARMNPFSEEGNDPIYNEYKGKRDTYRSVLKRKLNTGRYT